MRNPFTIIALMVIMAILGALYTFGWTPPWSPSAPDEALVVDEGVITESSSSSMAAARSSVRSESIQPVMPVRSSAPTIKEEVEVEYIPVSGAQSSAPASRASVSVASSTPASSRPPVNVITLPAKSSSSVAPAEGGYYQTTGD